MNWKSLAVLLMALGVSMMIWDAVGMVLTGLEAPLTFQLVWSALLGAVLAELGFSLRRR